MPNMNTEKLKMPEQAPDIRNKNFKEVALGYTEEMAVEEAQRCLNCKNKPCISGCPVHVRIPEFIAEVAKGNFLLPQLMHCLLYVVEFALKKANVNQNA